MSSDSKLEIKVLESFTWDGLVKWVDSLDDEDGEIGSDPSACWAGSQYILNHFGLQQKYNKKITPAELSLMSGWVHCFVENTHEFHHFSLLIDKEEIWLIQTYGAVQGLLKKKVNKIKWIQSLEKALKGSGEAWRKCFFIPSSYRIPENVGSSELNII